MLDRTPDYIQVLSGTIASNDGDGNANDEDEETNIAAEASNNLLALPQVTALLVSCQAILLSFELRRTFGVPIRRFVGGAPEGIPIWFTINQDNGWI